MRIKYVTLITALFFLSITLSCVHNADFDVPQSTCDDMLEGNTSFEELEKLFEGTTMQIRDDLVIEGYVISSDEASNLFNEIYLQDKPNNPTHGLLLEVELAQSHLLFPLGSKVLVSLKDLFLGKSGETLKIGSSFTSFGNISVGRLPALKVQEHVHLVCDGEVDLEPTVVSLQDLELVSPHTLVKLEGMEVVDEELGLTFAEPKEETLRTLQDCEETQIKLWTSGYADFQAEPLPEGNGTLTGILQKDGNNFQILIRDLNDLDFTADRCPEIITEFTSPNVFISELADPDNNTGARFVELYNASDQDLDLNLWTLRRYTNDNNEISSTTYLTGFIIEAQGTLLISPNAEEFTLVYGFPPDLGVSTNSPADSNGDDNLELVDPFGTIIDVFGVVGEHGTGTNHEFEDGRAVRNMDITEGNPTYTFGEWTIYNDSGDSGTIKLPQNAPEDFTPGIRE